MLHSGASSVNWNDVVVRFSLPWKGLWIWLELVITGLITNHFWILYLCHVMLNISRTFKTGFLKGWMRFQCFPDVFKAYVCYLQSPSCSTNMFLLFLTPVTFEGAQDKIPWTVKSQKHACAYGGRFTLSSSSCSFIKTLAVMPGVPSAAADGVGFAARIPCSSEPGLSDSSNVDATWAARCRASVEHYPACSHGPICPSELGELPYLTRAASVRGFGIRRYTRCLIF